MRQIDSELFVKLMQMAGGEDELLLADGCAVSEKDELWFAENRFVSEKDELWFADDCAVSEKGVKSTLPNSSLSTDADDRQTRSLLTMHERMVIDEIAEGLELALPCNYKEFREWVLRNDFDDVLVEADALFYDQYADVEDKCLRHLVNGREEDGSEASSSPSPDEDQGRRDKQIAKIIEECEKRGVDPLDIPTGEKGEIKDECLKVMDLFTDSGFDHAWKEANGRKVIRVRDKEKYLQNQH